MTLLDRIHRLCRPNVDTGSRSAHRQRWADRPRGSRETGATDSRSHRRGGTGVADRLQRGRQAAGRPRRRPSAAQAAPARCRWPSADGAADVVPVQPLEIAVTGGELGDVTVVDAAGTSVPGTVDGRRRRDGGRRLDARGPARVRHHATRSTRRDEQRRRRGDREVRPSPRSSPASVSTPVDRPAGRHDRGVGMPIRVYFDDPVADKAAVESHLKVTSSTPTDGTWNWINDKEVHFRPSQVLAGEHRRHPGREPVRGELRRRHLGREEPVGVLPHRRPSTSRSPTPRRTRCTVYDGDKVVQTYPMSAGSADKPDAATAPTSSPSPTATSRWTRAPSALAVDAPAGYPHRSSTPSASPTTASSCTPPRGRSAQQGHSNVSHGCINMSTERAAWFFHFSQPGDIVEVKNSDRPDRCHCRRRLYDWTIPWAKWQAGSALK